MKASNVAVGDLVKLTKAASRRYGMTGAAMRVTELRYRDGYRTPFVMVGVLAFCPSDLTWGGVA